MPEYSEPDDDLLPTNEDGTTIMEDNLESKARQDVYRKHLERQRSRDFDRSVLQLFTCSKSHIILTLH